MIGDLYFNKVEMGANTGLIGDAVSNFGLAGVFIMPIVLILVLRVLDMCTYGVENKLYIATAVLYAIILISSFLPTVLLTHGLIILAFVLFIMPKKMEKTLK